MSTAYGAFPPLVPQGFALEVCQVLDDFCQLGRAYREADEDDASRERVIRDIIGGQYNRPSRIVACNTAEGWSRDITEDIAREIIDRFARKSARVSPALQQFLEWATGEEPPHSMLEPEET